VEIALAIVAGMAIGSVLGFVGAGGSMLAVPIFIYVFGLSPVAATTASLLVVFVGAASGALPRIKQREVLIREALVIWAIGLITNLSGAYYLPRIPEKYVLTGFALVLIIAGVSMLVPTPQQQSERKVSPLALIGISLVIGALTGLFGIGGGFLAIPILILFYNVSPVKAAGTSLFFATSTAFMRPVIPDAVSEWPRFAFTDPTRHFVFIANAVPNASSSIGSPCFVPVPCASI